jgi:hypothetical protein
MGHRLVMYYWLFSSEVALDGWDERTTVYYFAPEDGFSSVLDVLVGTGNCNLCFV